MTSVAATLALAACARTQVATEPTLQPPGSAARIVETKVVRDLSQFDFITGYPKRFLEQRVAFSAACEMSTKSSDKGAAEDAKLLQKLASDSTSPEDFASSLQGRFELVQVAVEDQQVSAKEGMMTGYAAPEVVVRAKPDERFRFPIFGDLRKANPELADRPRRELVASDAARAQAIAWINDPLAWALVETNGSAKLTFDDGGLSKGKPKRVIYITRVATNGRPWTSIGRWLANRGLVDQSTYTFADVAAATQAHPDKAEDAALDNERVVFFTEVGEASYPPPVGLPSGKLMSGYSCAADQSVYPPGSVLVVFERDGRQPALRPARFLFVHDAGGAIVGPGRVDVYFGDGTDALLKAGQTRTPIEVYRLRRRG